MLDRLSERPKLRAAAASFVFVLMVVTMLGCSNHSVQTTSGKEYLAKHNIGTMKDVDRPEPTTSNPSSTLSSRAPITFDQALQHVADIEPTISFPARIGVAKIGCRFDPNRVLKPCGTIQPLYPEEVEAWSEMASNLGGSYGSIIPISPLVLDEALAEATKIGMDVASLSRVDRVRLGAARQHLDGIIIYETEQASTEETNALALGDLTLIGAFILPSKKVKGQAYAAAIMIDPVTGYPYGQVEATAESSSRYTPRVGASAEKRNVMHAAEANVVKALSVEAEKAIRKLRLSLAEEKSAAPN